MNYPFIKIKTKLKSQWIERFGILRQIFTTDEVQRVLDLEERFTFSDAKIFSRQMSPDGLSTIDTAHVAKEIRLTDTVHIQQLDESQWIMDKLQDIISEANYDLFLYNIEYLEGPLFLRYHGDTDSDNQGRYAPHRDTNADYGDTQRVISGIIMLSDRSEYTGGDLHIDIHGNYQPDNIELNKGDMVLFNSYCTHYVTNVESGTRKVLVFWVRGSESL